MIGECDEAGSAVPCHWLLLLAEFDRRGGWFQDGCASCAHWVSWRCLAAAAVPAGVLDGPPGPGPVTLAPLGADSPFDLGCAVEALTYFTGLS